MPTLCHPFSKRLTALTALLCVATGGSAWAQGTKEAKLKITGYLSVVSGQVLDGGVDAYYTGLNPIHGLACPCYLADWSDGGIPLNKNWEVQVGRKRIPLYDHSGYQELGGSSPWDATHYNGASLRYTTHFGQSLVSANLFGGREDVDKSLYGKLYDLDSVKVSWKNILGADLELNRGPMTVRGVYMTADINTSGLPGIVNAYDARLTAYGVAAHLDMNSWFVLSEMSKLTRDSPISGYSFSAPAASLGVGLRLGKWTPFLNYAQYVEGASDPLYLPATFRRSSASLRYDVDSNSGIKVQLDRNLDLTNNLGGPVTVFRVSYDRAF